MATKGKKKKGTPMSLSDFHASVAESAQSSGGALIGHSSGNAQSGLNWAEEMDRVELGIYTI